jgi:hypothetical protein
MQHAASPIQEPATAALPRLTTAEPALSGIGENRLGLDLPGPSPEADHSDREGEALEPVLTAAGR